MRGMVSGVLVLLLATAAGAQEWTFEDAGVPIAYFDNGEAQFQFACRGGDLAMGFWVRTPHAQVAKATALNLALTPDPPENSAVSASPDTSFAQDLPLIHSDGSSMIVRGPVARQWARVAQAAKDTMRVAYVRTASKGGIEAFDSNTFGAKGSKATIQKVLDRCG